MFLFDLYKKYMKKNKILHLLEIIICIFIIISIFIKFHGLDYNNFLGDTHFVIGILIMPICIWLCLESIFVQKILIIFNLLLSTSKYICFFHLPVYYAFRIIVPSNFILGGEEFSFFVYLITLYIICLITNSLSNRIKYSYKIKL